MAQSHHCHQCLQRGTAATRSSRTAKEKGDSGRAKNSLEALNIQLDNLEAEFESELAQVRDGITVDSIKLEHITLAPRKTEMGPLEVELVWIPIATDPKGRRRMLIEMETQAQCAIKNKDALGKCQGRLF